MQMFLLLTGAASGYLPPVLVGAIGTQLLCGIYSFIQPQRLAAIDMMQSTGTQVALTGAMGLNLLVAPHMLSALLLGFLGVEAYASASVWLVNNDRRLVG
jgi:hypothetical protein